MTLSATDRAMRVHGVGGSEIASLAGIAPGYFKGPLDIWLTKARGADGEIPPIIPPDEDEEVTEEGIPTGGAPRAQVGHALEPALRSLYTARTGIKVAPSPTLQHPRVPFVVASPDALAVAEPRGVELKVVGSTMVHHWDGDSVPDYVLAQAAWGMAVTDLPAWDVGALLGGTDFRIYHLLRDLDFEEALLEAAAVFWEGHVRADVPPEPTNAEEAQRYLRRRYPGGKVPCAVIGDGKDGEIAELARWLALAKEQKKLLEAAEKQLTTAFCTFCADNDAAGVEGGWGRFLWSPVRGNVSWKDVAEELAGGIVPAAIAEKHRGDAFRSPKFYPFNPNDTKTTKKRGSR